MLNPASLLLCSTWKHFVYTFVICMHMDICMHIRHIRIANARMHMTYASLVQMRQNLPSASTHQTCGTRAHRIFAGPPTCRQLRSVQNQIRQVVSHGAIEPDDASISSSKLVNRKSRQKSFRGKPPKADWKPSIGKARRSLRSAVMKSHCTEGDMLVRAVANAFFDEKHGLQACATGYLLAPVSYNVLAQYITQETDLEFASGFDPGHVSKEDAVLEDTLHEPRANLWGGGNDMTDLTHMLENHPDCKRFFTLLHSPNSNKQTPQVAEPYVIADLHALIEGGQLQKVQDVLPQVHHLTVHPQDPSYQTEFSRLTTV